MVPMCNGTMCVYFSIDFCIDMSVLNIRTRIYSREYMAIHVGLEVVRVF